MFPFLKRLSLCALIISSFIGAKHPSAVTYTFSGGRLGDNLLSYLHAKWISHVYNIKLLYKPFSYSDKLMLHTQEQLCTSEQIGKLKRIVEFRKNEPIDYTKKNTLYVIPYFPESLEEHRPSEPGENASNALPRVGYLDFPYFEVNWNDPIFLEKIRAMVKPNCALQLIQPPKDCLSIAVHVRKNSGGFDRPLLHNLPEHLYNPSTVYVDVVFPLKHAPDSFYIEQINRIIAMYPDQKYYIYLFTDDPNPAEIARYYQNEINNPSVHIDFRTTENKHDANVLEDLFSMMNFDCFVRGDSNLSIVASKLGDYKVLITPAHHRWEGRKLIIDQVNIVQKK